MSSIEYSFIKENRSDGLHELHNGYPLALEKLSDKMSNYYSNIADEYGITIGDVKRLVPNLGNKSKYVLHYRNLQLHISLGMKLVKVHKILKFKQSDWLKKCIDLNTGKRKNAPNSFEKDFFKLMNNSTFGKIMENLRKQTLDWLIMLEIMKNKPSFVSQKIFSKHFIAIHEIKRVLTLDKPIYVGFSILDSRKLLMYELNYKYSKRKYNTKLLFTYKDNLFYQVKTDDVYEDSYEDKSLFDFSDYPKDPKIFDPVNKKLIR